MKKLFLILTVLILALSITGYGNAETYVLRLGIEHEPSHPYTKSMEKFVELVAEKTNGNVKIILYPSAQLGSAPEMIEGMQLGTIDLVLTVPTYYRSFVPETDILLIPFIFKDAEHYQRVMVGKVGDFLNKKLNEKGIVNLAYYYGGMRQFTNNRGPINSVSDVKNLKMRVAGLPVIIKSFGKFDVQTTPVNFSELYTALQTGLVDAQENPVAQIYSSKFYEVQKYLSISNHMLTTLNLAISKQSMDDLPENYQTALKEAAKEVVPWNLENFKKVEIDLLQKLKDVGMQVNEVADIESFIKAAEPLYTEIPELLGSQEADWIIKEITNNR